MVDHQNTDALHSLRVQAVRLGGGPILFPGPFLKYVERERTKGGDEGGGGEVRGGAAST